MGKKLSAIALYLPQFHCLPENDLWWGKGFTEWTTVKAAKSLFKGHNQPKKPLNGNYYNLLEKKTMQWQASLAKKYMIDGFCFYHYWFKDGRKILEKPAENLLKWKDIPMSFCFSWANETWARSWDAMPNKNAWADKFEPKYMQNSDGVLLEQEYGKEVQWEEHFNYLLPFFLDHRYIRVDGKPVFVIYRPELIPCLERMTACWRRLAHAAGLSGLYIIGTNVAMKNFTFDAVMLHMARNAGLYFEKMDLRLPVIIDYDKRWKGYLATPPVCGIKTLWCGYVGYDDTPRRADKGAVYVGGNPQKFMAYFRKLVQKSVQTNNPLVFINAWNEWGEGMYLEPDEEYGYGYLEAVQSVMEAYEKGNLMEDSQFGDAPYHTTDEADHAKDILIAHLEARVEKFKQYYDLMHNWLLLKENGKSIEKYFLAHGYRKIAIYGYGTNGKHIMAELQPGSIEIAYAVDRGKSMIYAEIPVYDLSDSLPDCDIMVVTIVNEYSAILNELQKKVTCPVVSLAEIISEL